MAKISPTDKQWVFIKHYAATLNITESAQVARFSNESEGRRLLKKKHIIDAVNREMAKVGNEANVTASRVLQELMRIAFFDPSKLFDDHGRPRPLSEMDEDTRRCINVISFTVEGRGDDATVVQQYKILDKIKALEHIGRHLAMFTDKLKVDTNTQLEQMSDDQLRDTVEQLAKATGFDLRAAKAPETKH